MIPKKKIFNTRLSEEAHRLLTVLAEHKGTSKTDILEMAIREMAKKEKVTTHTTP